MRWQAPCLVFFDSVLYVCGTGYVKEDREVATFASIIGFALFHTTIRFFLSLKGITADTVSIDYLMGQGYSLLEATQQNAPMTRLWVSLPTV